MFNRPNIDQSSYMRFGIIEYLILSGLLFLMYLSSLYNYLLFHTIAELSAIIISVGIFVVGWNSRIYIKNSFYLVVGLSFLFIAVIDLIHTLAYTGLNIFVGFDSNLPTSLWILARYWQSISFVVALILFNKKVNFYYLTVAQIILVTLFLTLIFQGLFPICYIEEIEQLTPFKIISEYVIDSIFIISFIWMYKLRNEFDRKVFTFIIISIIFMIFSELAFTLYTDVYGLANLVGHLFKIIAFYHIYKAIIKIGIKEPYNSLFRKIKLNENELTKKAAELEIVNVDFNQIFEASLPLRIIDKECNIIRVNDTYCALFNIKREDILGKKCYDCSPVSYCNSEMCSMKQVLSGTRNYEYVAEQALDTNKKRVFIVHSVPYLNVRGDFLGIIQNFTDITQRREAQEKLEISEYRYRTTFEQSPDGIIIFDPDTAKAYEFNNAICKMLGYTREEFSKLNVNDYDINESAAETRMHINKILREGSDTFETKFKTKTGEIKDVSVLTNIMELSGKKYFQSICRDITERKRAEEKIEDMARFPLENPNPVLRVNEKYVLLANNASQELFNIGEASLLPELLREPIKQCFLELQNNEAELHIKNEFYTFFFILNEKKRYVNIYGLNITERLKAKRRLERFVSTVSHELRNPISVLVTSIDFLENHAEKVTQDIEKKLKEGMTKNIHLLKDLVDDILMLSRIDDRKIVLEWKELKPYDLIQEILVLMEPIGNMKNITFNVKIDPNLILYADAKRLDQIFRIFIDNAIKYSAKNSIIEIETIDQYKGIYNEEGLDGILFKIQDHGIGVSKDDLNHLFERFFRSDKVSDIPGTGLGLSIAKELIELHKGSVYVESELMKGTTFYIFIPRIKSL